MEAAREIAADYQVDGLALEYGILQGALERRGSDRKFLGEEALILVDRAVEEDRFGIAMEMAALAQAAGISGRGYEALVQQVRSRRGAFEQVEKALIDLAENPEDPRLNLIVGEYRCFVQGRWDEGLLLLAKGRDASLRRIAAADLLQPGQPEGRYRVGRNWWGLAESRPDHALVIRSRAIYWYRLCQDRLGGLDRATVVARIRGETNRVIAAARALSRDGLPRLAAYRLERAVHLDPGTVVDAIEALGDPAAPRELVPELFSARSGGSATVGVATRRAISNGLEWLKSHQDADGRWDADEFMKHDVEGEPSDGAGNALHDVGITGLALLAFLGDGNTMRSGPYRDVVSNAVAWLRGQQGDNGLFGSNAAHDFIYDHALASLAIGARRGLSLVEARAHLPDRKELGRKRGHPG